MNQMQILEEFRPIIEKLCNQECSIQDAMTFICKNYEYLKEKDLKEKDKFYLIYNNKNLYGIIIVNENEYEWSLYNEEEGFSPLIKLSSTKNDIKNSDYIIEMMIHFADSSKVKDIVPEIETMNIENKVKTLKRIGLNSKGYHFR